MRNPLALTLGFVVCLLSAATAAPPTPVTIAVVRHGEPSQAQLQLTQESGGSLRARWTVAGTDWEALCKPTLRRGSAQIHKGSCRPLSQVGLAGALASSEEVGGDDWRLTLVVDRARGQVRGAVLGTSLRFSAPTVDHSFSGLLPIRVGDRWLPRLKLGPEPAGWIDGLLANDPLPPSADEGGLPLPTPTSRALGKLVVLVPGMFNMPPSHDLVVRLTKHADTVVIAYCNPYPEQSAGLHLVEALDGRELPAELRGRVLAQGHPTPLINSYPQTSDRVLEVFEALRQSPLFTSDPLQAHATLIGHSQGTLAVLLTRKRLRAAGFPDAVGTTVGLAPPYRGLSIADSSVVRWISRRISLLAPGLPDTLEELRPASVRTRIGDARFDVVVTGFKLDAPESDGVVSVETARLAALRFRALAGYDHAKIFQGPAVADVAVRTLLSR